MPSPFSKPFRWLLVLGLLLCAAEAHAQLVVDLQIKRRLFMRYEPILATVVVHNNAGRDVMLADTAEGGPWFQFHITAENNSLVAPSNAHYEVEPLLVKNGESVKRTVNLGSLFPLGDFGTYHVKASVFYPTTGKFFTSKVDHFSVMEGKVVWRQTVGVPDGMQGEGDNRLMSLLTMETDKGRNLYVRVEGDDAIYGCYDLGRMADGAAPDAKFDSGNNMAILHLIGPKTYSLSRVGVNGAFLGQGTYVTPKTQPYLRRNPEGQLQIVGAVRQQETVARSEPSVVPKVSDRPPGF
jgi:hypothetical protein